MRSVPSARGKRPRALAYRVRASALRLLAAVCLPEDSPGHWISAVNFPARAENNRSTNEPLTLRAATVPLIVSEPLGDGAPLSRVIVAASPSAAIANEPEPCRGVAVGSPSNACQLTTMLSPAIGSFDAAIARCSGRSVRVGPWLNSVSVTVNWSAGDDEGGSLCCAVLRGEAPIPQANAA